MTQLLSSCTSHNGRYMPCKGKDHGWANNKVFDCVIEISSFVPKFAIGGIAIQIV